MPVLCLIPGDGIGREVIPAAARVLRAAMPDLETIPAEAGWDCFQRTGEILPAETVANVEAAGAALFGAVSSPAYAVAGYRSVILALRQHFELYANIRPVKSWPHLSARSDVKLTIVRENTEGLYVGRERLEPGRAIAERVITKKASARLARRAAALVSAETRRITIVHKANILPLSDGLFRDTVRAELGKALSHNASVVVDEMLVDLAALRMLSDPDDYDLIITTNLFGDILSDAAAYWGGGLGMAPSLNWGDRIAVAEPVHGSAPDIAGQGIANPIAAILSAALLARHVWDRPQAADRMEGAVQSYLETAPLIARSAPVLTDRITSGVLAHLAADSQASRSS